MQDPAAWEAGGEGQEPGTLPEPHPRDAAPSTLPAKAPGALKSKEAAESSGAGVPPVLSRPVQFPRGSIPGQADPDWWSLGSGPSQPPHWPGPSSHQALG